MLLGASSQCWSTESDLLALVVVEATRWGRGELYGAKRDVDVAGLGPYSPGREVIQCHTTMFLILGTSFSHYVFVPIVLKLFLNNVQAIYHVPRSIYSKTFVSMAQTRRRCRLRFPINLVSEQHVLNLAITVPHLPR